MSPNPPLLPITTISARLDLWELSDQINLKVHVSLFLQILCTTNHLILCQVKRSMQPHWLSCITKFIYELNCSYTIPIPSLPSIVVSVALLLIQLTTSTIPQLQQQQLKQHWTFWKSKSHPWPISPYSMWHESSHLVSRREENTTAKHATRFGLLYKLHIQFKPHWSS